MPEGNPEVGLWPLDLCLSQKNLACVRPVSEGVWNGSLSLVLWVKTAGASAGESEQTLGLLLRTAPE